ncbi:MAG TPA: NAD(P)H-binding protein [Woeseiaceae bacterium]|nr:NAD(P)H-binding protein [Woeseiaceae bacterium]
MKITVFGGTGFVGSHAVRSLVAAGHRVSLLVRSGSEHKIPDVEIWRRVTGDLCDEAALDSVLKDCDAVLYSVGLLKEFPKQGITYENTQYQGVVRAAASASRHGARRFVLISANGVKQPGTKYQETKLRAEQHLMNSDLDVTILRPSVIFGDPDGKIEFATQLHRDMVAQPFPAVGFFSGFMPGRGQVLMSPAHIGDVTTALCTVFESPATISQTYLIGGPEILSWPEMIRRIAAAVDRRKWIVPMPIGLMKLMALLFGWLPFFPVTRDQLTMLAENNIADPDALEQLTGDTLTPMTAANLAYLKKPDAH